MQREAFEQEALFRWAAWMEPRVPELRLLFHVPNGGSRDRREAALAAVSAQLTEG